MPKTIQKWWIMTTVSLLTVMLNIDATAVNLAIPQMAYDLSSSLSEMQWVLTAYTLVSAMFQILGGRLGDAYGYRNFFLIGTVLFILSSLSAGIAINEPILITSRAFQGLALGLAYPTTIALVYSVFPKHQHGLAMGVIMGVMGISLALGPTIGGLILRFLDWRWIFFVNLPIGILTVILIFVFCPKDKIQGQHEPFDLSGATFLMIALFGLILPLNEMQDWGLVSSRFWLIFAGGIVAGLILYFIERRHKNPIIDFALFKIRNFSVNSFTRVIAQLVFIPVLFIIPIYLQNIARYGELITGFIMLALTVVIAALSPIAGRFVDLLGSKLLTAISLLILAAGCWLFTFLNAEPNMGLLIPALILVGIGTGINFVSTTSGALALIPEKQAGLGTGIFFTIVWGSCALAVAMIGSILAMVSSHYLNAQLAVNQIQLSSAVYDATQRIAHGISPITQLPYLFKGDQFQTILKLVKSSFIRGFHTAFWVLVAMSVFGFIVSLFEHPVSISSEDGTEHS